MAKDKKGKGSGSKDACYHKVKSRYSVWPSAYASGALVKCRKVGAANWGNKSESFEVQEGGNFMRGKDSQIARSTGAGALTPDAAKQLGKKAEDLQKKKAAKVDVPKFKKEEVESVEEGKSSRPMGEPFHSMSRGMKQKRGAKRNEGDGKYVKMQHIKRANKREADLDAHRERQKNERGLSMYPEEVDVTEGKYSKSETYVKGTAPVRATYGGKTESFPKETYKKKSKTEELNIDLAVDYFFTEGINEDGLEMIIEETGLEKFVEFVEYLTDIEVLTEARAARKARKGAKSYEQVKAEIDAKEKAKSAKREISVDKTKKATETAKAKQPEKKPVRDAIARGVFRAVDAYKKGMERHNAAMATAKKAGKVAGKAAGELAKGAGEGVKTAGKAVKMAHAVATKEEVEVDEKYQGMYQSPAPTYNRLKSSDEKARMSPGRRAIAKSDELEKSEPGSKRAKAQKKAASQMARNFQSARATTREEVEVSEGDKYDNVGKQAARMSLLNNPGPRSTPEQSAAQKKRLEKKHGMKLDDHPQFKKEEVGEGYRVVSTSFKSGDGDHKDDVTIKKQKKVVSGDNLTKKGAERSANARRQEYGAGDAFQVQKTKTAKKRPSNAASEAEVKAKIDAKEKKQQKSRAQQSIDGMNRAGTPSGKVAAARLKTDKKFNKEEVDKRRAPAELVARLSAKREGHMAQDGPNKAAYDAKQRILKKTKDKMTEEIVRSILDEAGKKCWKGYKKAGTQKLFGKTYNRCVKANEELSIDQQMKISRDYNRMSPEEKKAANKKAMGNVKKVAPKKDTRTDAQKMTDATGPRPGSRYRGD